MRCKIAGWKIDRLKDVFLYSNLEFSIVMLLEGNLFSLQTHLFPSYSDLKDFVFENGKRYRVLKQHSRPAHTFPKTQIMGYTEPT